MRVALVCPYSFDAPGGVQAHVVDLAAALRRRGHHVRVLAPGTPGGELAHTDPELTLAGPGLAIPYNGSVARLSFGLPTWRATRRWLRAEPIDVLHIHEPNAPSVGLAALALSTGPVVATFHTSTTGSRALDLAEGALRPFLERIRGRIAVSPMARRWQIEALGSDAVEIPNGVDVGFFAAAVTDPRTAEERTDGPSVCFLGRWDEPRKGMDVLLRALPAVAEQVPGLTLRVMGAGDERRLADRMPPGVRLDVLGRVDDARKARVLAAADVYCAPQTGGESFGIVLAEAMAAGTAVVAADLEAFRRVLGGGSAGVEPEAGDGAGAAGEVFPVGDAAGLARALVRTLTDDALRAALVERGRVAVRQYDWETVTDQVLRVYETIAAPGELVRVR